MTFRFLRPYVECPLYRRERAQRGCRDEVIRCTAWVLVVLYYGAMAALVLGAAMSDDILPGAAVFAVALILLGDPACRLLGVVNGGDAFSTERTERTLDHLALSPLPRGTLVGAKLLARLRPYRNPLLAVLPGLSIFPPLFAALMLHHLPAEVGLGPDAWLGLTLTLYVVTLYPLVGWTCSFGLGNVTGMFFSLAIRGSGLGMALAFGTIFALSLGFCFLSYFALGFGGVLGGLGVAKLHPTIGLIPGVILIVEEVLSRGLPLVLLHHWMVSDFDRLAAD